MTLLVHGIIDVEEAGLPALDDISEPAPEPVSYITGSASRLAALVSHVPGEEVLPTRRLLLGHARVVEHVNTATTVLPLRFGTTVPSEDHLRREVLDARASPLRDTLERLRGQTELRLRGRYDEPTVLRDIVEHDRTVARLRHRADSAARMELGERIVAALDARRRTDAQRASGHLEGLATAVAFEAVREPLEAFSFSVLVRRDGTSDVEVAVDRLAQHLAPMISLELIGPHPPYSFVGEVSGWDS